MNEVLDKLKEENQRLRKNMREAQKLLSHLRYQSPFSHQLSRQVKEKMEELIAVR